MSRALPRIAIRGSQRGVHARSSAEGPFHDRLGATLGYSRLRGGKLARLGPQDRVFPWLLCFFCRAVGV